MVQMEKAGGEALPHCPPSPGRHSFLEQRRPGQVSLSCGLGTPICDLGTMAQSPSQEVGGFCAMAVKA